MAATNYTPISLYYSTTASATPSAGNLVNGELALNIQDEKLYFKNAAGTVKLLASNAATTPVTPGGSNTQVQYNSSGSFAGSANMTFNGTTLTLANDASISGLTVGKGAGAVATNTAVGASALAGNSTGAYATAIGYNAGNVYTGGSDNNGSVFLGAYAGRVTTTGADNIFVGANSGNVNTTGGSNVAVGSPSLNSNTTGSYNTALGRSALSSSTTSSNNVAIGFEAGYSNTTGTKNVCIGSGTGYTNSTGYENTFVGRYAGRLATGSSNVFLGEQAGVAATTGTFNTFLGIYSGADMTTGAKNTILGRFQGNQGGLDIRTANNYIVLSDGDGNPRAYSDGSGIWYDQYGKLRAVPAVGTKTSSYTLATTDVGRYVQVSTGGSIVVPDATFSEGDVVSVFNNTSGTITITCSITTAYIAGTYTDKATMTLAAAGVATVLFISGTLCVVSGNVT